MRRVATCLLIVFVTGLVAGCGGASGIQSGMPANTSPPPGFDPGGTAKPDMSGKAARSSVR